MTGRRVTTTALAFAGLALAGAGGFALAGQAAPAAPKSYLLKATLSAAREVPAVTGLPAAAGTFSATLTVSGKKGTLAWKLTYKGLSGRALAAHVHLGLAGKSGPVAIPLCTSCRSGVHGVYTTSNAKLLAALRHKGAYSNVHTKAHPAGEIRGQIAVTGTTSKPATDSTSTTSTTATTTYSNPYGGG